MAYYMYIWIRVLLVFMALVGVAVGTYIGLTPIDPPSCGTGLRPEGMCFFETTPDERRPRALGVLAGSVGLLLVAFLVGRYRWTGRDL